MTEYDCRNNLQRLNRNQGTHAGLLLSRYLHFAVTKEKHIKDRKELFTAAITACKSAKPLYELAYDRWKKSTDNLVNAELSVYKSSRLIVGLSGESVLETGLALHHTYGVPIIPGSALKGLASHYCHQVWGENDAKFKINGEYYRVLFGDTGENDQDEGAGHITFYDAWITPNSLEKALDPDVITPHHPKYYNPDGELPPPPADYDDPNPVTFLSVRGRFRICLSCDLVESSGGNGGKEWVNLALQLLKQALDNWGVGGKTSSGYGRLK